MLLAHFFFTNNLIFICRDATDLSENKAIVSKSCEDLTRDNQEEDDNQLSIMNKRTKERKSTNKKFAFQSTIRQIERKKIAEKLSKEAEYKGNPSKFSNYQHFYYNRFK